MDRGSIDTLGLDSLLTRSGQIVAIPIPSDFMSLLRRARTAVRAVGVLILSLGLPASMAGQAADSPEIGARVRVRLPGHGAGWLQGHLAMLSADSAAIALTETPDSVRFATASAERVEVSQGRHSHAGKGAVVGLGVGAATGLILGLAASAEPCEDLCMYEVGPGEIAGATVMLGAVGAGIGALIGSFSHGERWKRVDLHPSGPPRLTPVARAGGLGIALRF